MKNSATTPAVEAYLEIIYLMEVEEQPVIGARLAESQHVSRPTVTAALKRMIKEGLVRINDRKEIFLTAKGQSLAEYLQRRHCIIERWLVDELGLDWAASDAEAHRLEHAMSDAVAEMLNKNLGYPTTCPHGNPVPGNGRKTTSTEKNFRLNAAVRDDQVIVSRVSEYDQDVAELLNYLGERGIRPGAEIKVTEVAPMKGPLTIKVGSRLVSLSRETAKYVWVKKAV